MNIQYKAVIQETGVRVPPDTKRHESFPDPIQEVFVHNFNQTSQMFSQTQPRVIFAVCNDRTRRARGFVGDEFGGERVGQTPLKTSW